MLSEININKHLDVRAFVAYAKENGVSTLDLAKEGRKMFLMAREKKTCTLDEFREEYLQDLLVFLKWAVG